MLGETERNIPLREEPTGKRVELTYDQNLESFCGFNTRRVDQSWRRFALQSHSHGITVNRGGFKRFPRTLIKIQPPYLVSNKTTACVQGSTSHFP